MNKVVVDFYVGHRSMAAKIDKEIVSAYNYLQKK